MNEYTIMQAKQLIDSIFDDLSKTLHQVDVHQIEEFETSIVDARRIFVVGKGRTGLQMKAFAMRLMQLGLQVFVVGDATTPSIQPFDLLIIGSGSGHTESLIGYAKSALSNDASLALITGNLKSPIAKLSNTLVYIPASNFKSGEQIDSPPVLLMGSLFEHAIGLLFDLVAVQLKDKLERSEDIMNSLHANLE